MIKATILKISLMLLLACLMGAGCKKEEEYTNEDKLSERINSASLGVMQVNDMPVWLQNRVHEIEKIALVESNIYQFEWKKQTGYFIYVNFNSHVGDVYDLTGTKITFDDGQKFDDYIATSKSWKKIWSFCDCDWKNV